MEPLSWLTRFETWQFIGAGIIIISALIAIAAIINNTAWLIGQWWSDAVIAFRQWHRQQERKGTGV